MSIFDDIRIAKARLGDVSVDKIVADIKSKLNANNKPLSVTDDLLLQIATNLESIDDKTNYINSTYLRPDFTVKTIVLTNVSDYGKEFTIDYEGDSLFILTRYMYPDISEAWDRYQIDSDDGAFEISFDNGSWTYANKFDIIKVNFKQVKIKTARTSSPSLPYYIYVVVSRNLKWPINNEKKLAYLLARQNAGNGLIFRNDVTTKSYRYYETKASFFQGSQAANTSVGIVTKGTYDMVIFELGVQTSLAALPTTFHCTFRQFGSVEIVSRLALTTVFSYAHIVFAEPYPQIADDLELMTVGTAGNTCNYWVHANNA
jgi:hypothetical protein